MSVLNRQEEILRLLRKMDSPVSGSTLSKHFGVSRQIIVQDINQLKKAGKPIISTTKGYILDPGRRVERVFKVKHTIDETESELNLIVDLGAEIKDVFIFHKVYGEIFAKLNISSRRDIQAFMDDIRSGKSSPLMTVTSGYHYHTVTAKDPETLDLVDKALKENGFFAPLTDYEPSILLENE